MRLTSVSCPGCGGQMEERVVETASARQPRRGVAFGQRVLELETEPVGQETRRVYEVECRSADCARWCAQIDAGVLTWMRRPVEPTARSLIRQHTARAKETAPAAADAFVDEFYSPVSLCTAIKPVSIETSASPFSPPPTATPMPVGAVIGEITVTDQMTMRQALDALHTKLWGMGLKDISFDIHPVVAPVHGVPLLDPAGSGVHRRVIVADPIRGVEYLNCGHAHRCPPSRTMLSVGQDVNCTQCTQ